MRLTSAHRRGLALLASVAILYAAVFSLWTVRAKSRELKLSASKAEHLHYDIVELSLVSGDPALDESFAAAPPRFVVMRGTETLTTIAGIREMKAARTAPGRWIARWPVPWNAPRRLPSRCSDGRPRGRLPLSVSIAGESPSRCRKGFVVATLESVAPLASMKVKGPDGP